MASAEPTAAIDTPSTVATPGPSLPDRSTTARGLPPIIASLAHRDFRLLWTSICVLSAGQWIQQVTLGWLVYEMTGSPVMLGLMHTLRSSPFLFAGPIAGVAADRMDRRKDRKSTRLNSSHT